MDHLTLHKDRHFNNPSEQDNWNHEFVPTNPVEWEYDHTDNKNYYCDPNKQIQYRCYSYMCTNCYRIDLLLGKIEYLTIAPTSRYIYFGQYSQRMEIGIDTDHSIEMGTNVPYLSMGENSKEILIGIKSPLINVGDDNGTLNLKSLYIINDGHIIPKKPSTYDIGKNNRRVRNGFFVYLHSAHYYGWGWGSGFRYSTSQWNNIQNNYADYKSNVDNFYSSMEDFSGETTDTESNNNAESILADAPKPIHEDSFATYHLKPNDYDSFSAYPYPRSY